MFKRHHYGMLNYFSTARITNAAVEGLNAKIQTIKKMAYGYTLPGGDVTVTSGTSGGQPTLVLTAGTDGVGPGYTEQLTIDATTGVPVSFASGAPGQAPSGTVSYQVSRVTKSDIAAGKL